MLKMLIETVRLRQTTDYFGIVFVKHLVDHLLFILSEV